MWDKEKAERMTKAAIQLFKEYIAKDSKNPINIPYRIYSKFEKSIESYIDPTNENNSNITRTESKYFKPNKDIFDECEKECVLMLEHDTLPRFCQSNLFKTEIIEASILPKILKL